MICPHLGPVQVPHFKIASGVVKPLHVCHHPANEHKAAIQAICESCTPKPNDPVACSHCPWIDPATGEERSEPLPAVVSEFHNNLDGRMLVTAPPPGSAKVKIVPFTGSSPSPPPKAKRTAVVSYAIGQEVCAEQAVTAPNHRAYANRIGAEFIMRSWPNATLPYGPAIKWEAAKHAKDYDAILVLDPDVVVTRRAPNIFDFVPLGVWGVVDERPHLRYPQFGLAAQETAARDLGIVNHWAPHIANGGVMVMPPDAERVYYASEFGLGHWEREQAVLSVHLQNGDAPYRLLDPRFNTCWHYRTGFDVHRAWMIHRAGQNATESSEARFRGLVTDVARETP
jgi:hypothetical protein